MSKNETNEEQVEEEVTEDVVEETELTDEQKYAEAVAGWKRALADYDNLK
jgi:hypothetical protein